MDELVSAVVHARNVMPMTSGRSPVELAFGRPPEPDFNLEGKNISELHHLDECKGIREDLDARTMRIMAMQAHLQACQSQDMIRDCARNVQASEGPFNPGDEVYWYMKDHSHFKQSMPGRWIPGKVLLQEGESYVLSHADRCIM